jgi:hypothetical protein
MGGLANYQRHAPRQHDFPSTTGSFQLADELRQPNASMWALKQCIRPAVKRTDFELRILTDQQGAGLIDNQIRAALLSARFVISDLTHGSYDAYWRQALVRVAVSP